MKKTLLLLLLAVISLFPACKKSHSNPCEGIYALPSPPKLGVIFLDKTTGENILVSRNIDSANITITPTSKSYIDRTTDTKLYGALRFSINYYELGAHTYTIIIPEIGTATLTYSNNEKSTGNICNPTRIELTNPSITEFPSTLEVLGNVYIITVKI